MVLGLGVVGFRVWFLVLGRGNMGLRIIARVRFLDLVDCVRVWEVEFVGLGCILSLSGLGLGSFWSWVGWFWDWVWVLGLGRDILGLRVSGLVLGGWLIVLGYGG